MNAKAAFLLLLLAPSVCRAYDPNYCPFRPDQRPAARAILCEPSIKERTPEKNLYLFAVGPGTMLVVQQKEPSGLATASLIEKGKVVGGPVTLGGSARLGLRVWAANLTSRNSPRQDVIIGTANPGNGLAASLSFVCFFLRSKDGYRTVEGLTYHLDDNDFVDLNKDGQVEWVQTEFIRGCVGRDGKAHNYWVLNLIRFQQDRPTLANAIDKRFPSWIWFTFKPNHQNTTQLTDAQKQQLFGEQARGLGIYPAQSVATAQGRNKRSQ